MLSPQPPKEGWGGGFERNRMCFAKIMRLFYGDVFFYTSTSQKTNTKTAY